MTRRFVVRKEAERDLDEAYAWYADRSLEVAEGFLDAFEEMRNRIVAWPRRFPILFAELGVDVRRALLNNFPYGVLFVWDEESDSLSIVACFHVRRDPALWHDRL